jgi:hypothetical protein
MLRVKSDVYSFGMVLLQIITTNPAMEPDPVPPPMGLTHHGTTSGARRSVARSRTCSTRSCQIGPSRWRSASPRWRSDAACYGALGEDNVQYCESIRGGSGDLNSSSFLTNASRSHVVSFS